VVDAGVEGVDGARGLLRAGEAGPQRLVEPRDMLVCMRTTINLPDSLGTEAKARALAQGRTFTSLVEEGLRMVLADEDGGAEPQPVQPLPAFGDSGRGFLVDPSDREALWGALDADGPR
jgi:hypothetical protein